MFIDYLVILIYLALLLIVNLLLFFCVLGEIPGFTEFQLQLVAFYTSVVLVMTIFSVLDYKKPFGTYGKRKVGLKVNYETPSFLRSLARNIIKFLPWQLAHIGVIDGLYTEFTSWISIVFTYTGIMLVLIMLFMGLFRKDKRHISDIVAGTQVIAINS